MKCHFLIIGVLIVDLHFCILKYTSAELLARRQTIYNLLRAALKEDWLFILLLYHFVATEVHTQTPQYPQSSVN